MKEKAQLLLVKMLMTPQQATLTERVRLPRPAALPARTLALSKFRNQQMVNVRETRGPRQCGNLKEDADEQR